MSADVLLVEDDPADARLVAEAFAAVEHETTLTTVTDRRSALAELRRERPGSELPSLVLLDLHLDGCRGEAVLEEIKSDPALRRVPVVVFSDSDDLEDIRDMYDLQANAYVTKPRDMDQYVAVAERLAGFWFRTAQLAPEVADG